MKNNKNSKKYSESENISKTDIEQQIEEESNFFQRIEKILNAHAH